MCLYLAAWNTLLSTHNFFTDWKIIAQEWGLHMAPTAQGFSLPTTHPQLAVTLSMYPPGPHDHRQSHCWARAGKLWSGRQQVGGLLPVAKGTSGWRSFSQWEVRWDLGFWVGECSATDSVSCLPRVESGMGGKEREGVQQKIQLQGTLLRVSKQTKFTISRKALSKAGLHH